MVRGAELAVASRAISRLMASIVRIVICWSDISGYMAACWRALAGETDVELFVLANQVGAGEPDIAFGEHLMRGLRFRMLGREQMSDRALVGQIVAEHDPDVVVISGWSNPSYKALLSNPKLERASFVVGMDTSWRGTWRQRVGRFAVASYLKRMAAVVVAGERAWQYARWLGVPESKLVRGVYGFDAEPLEDLLQQRSAAPW